MLAWMIYVLVVSALLGGAAYAAERSAHMRGASTRWLWGVSLVAALLLPTVVSSVSIQVPDLPAAIGAAAPQGPLALRQMTLGAVQPSAWLDAAIGPAAGGPSVDAILARAWAAASALILLVILFHGVRLHRRRRAWTRQVIAGASVQVSPDVGPAVVGLLRPRIVIPRWIAEAPPETQALVLAHERSHLEAGDAQLLALAILLVAAMPWNLPLWWQLRRLRQAIEMDCDARVLRAGHDVGRYGATLIMVGERQSARVAVVAAMSETGSFLEQRIRRMVRRPQKFAWAGAAALACLGLVLAASAAEVRPPNAASLVPASAPAPAAALRPYHSDKWGFALDVPSRWNEFPPDLANSPFEVARFQSGEHGAHDLLVFRSPYDPATGPDAVVAGTQRILASQGFSHFIGREAKIGSRTIRTLDFYRPTPGGPTWTCRYYFFPEGTLMYVLAFGSTDPQAMFPLYDRIAQTFDAPGPSAAADAALPAVDRGGAAKAHAEVAVRLVDTAPAGPRGPGAERVAAPDGGDLWLEPGVPITGAMFASAQAGRDAAGSPTVDFSLTPEGARRLADLTRENVGKRLAILVDGKVVWAPVIRDEIAGGKGQISGRFTPGQTEALAADIRAAAAGR
jgi:beta-lactamase regulating signal transducer with metallopeptidase domain